MVADSGNELTERVSKVVDAQGTERPAYAVQVGDTVTFTVEQRIHDDPAPQQGDGRLDLKEIEALKSPKTAVLI